MDLNRRFCFLIHVIAILLFSMNFFFFSTYQSAITPATTNFANQTDQIALLAFKNQINDQFGALSSWNHSSHFCTWSGVTCSRRHRQRVTGLDLYSKNLVGSISPYIGNLTFLKYFSLASNSFSGEIPREIGNLFRLQSLNLSENLLQGQIPISVTYCSELMDFDVRVNQLTGRIPTELGSLSKLTYLDLGQNNLSSTIPVSLSNLSSLTALTLSHNHLTGNIPLELGHLSELEYLDISYNYLSGTIPIQLYNISTIYSFAVVHNRFYGTIPSDIGLTLPNLQYLLMGLNSFSGSLPNSIYNASQLVSLGLSGNQFTGRILPNLGLLQLLTFLNLDSNQFGARDGTNDLIFLNSLTNCSHLEELTLNNNNVMGKLPLSIGNFSIKLSTFVIGTNRISGKIPTEIGNLVGLATLELNNNLLTGHIPVSIGKLPGLIEIFLYGNKLSGQIPSNVCNNTELATISLSDNRLGGRIPPSLGNCKKLETLALDQNQLVGTVPKQVIGLSDMIVGLYLYQNLLTGNLPEEIGNLTSLVRLDLSNNKLSGEIPSSLGNCLGLNILFLDGNIFQGIIPASFNRLKGIQYLDLSRNKLSGKIPEYLESFDSLQYLNLSSNDFEGEVPKQGLIFKNASAFSVSGNPKLCGGISQLKLQNCPNRGFEKQKRRIPLKKMFLIIGAVTCSILLGLFLIFFWSKKAKKKLTSSASPSENVFQKITYKELLKATDGFSSEKLVGVGSYGSVYKGRIGQETTTDVAVKVLDLARRGASKSFKAECEALRCIRHRNLVKVLTSCSSIDYKGNEFKAMVFEFMPNGNLDNWLHPTSNGQQFQGRRSLSFMKRLKLGIDVAHALEYLHHRSHTPIVHCDLKPSNILLDNEMNGHVGDFGLAKFLSGARNVESGNDTSSVGIRGSIGYAAPEYGIGGEVSTSGDVYSYGILLLEMFTGRRPTDAMFKDGLSLHSFANSALSDQVMQIIDPTLFYNQDDEDGDEALTISANGENEAMESLINLVKLGVLCSSESPRERLEMVDVVKEVESIKNSFLRLQVAP